MPITRQRRKQKFEKLKEVNCCVRDEKVKLPAVRRTGRKIENTTRIVLLLIT